MDLAQYPEIVHHDSAGDQQQDRRGDAHRQVQKCISRVSNNCCCIRMISSDSPEGQCMWPPKSGKLPCQVFLEGLGYSRTFQSIAVIEIKVGYGYYESSGGTYFCLLILELSICWVSGNNPCSYSLIPLKNGPLNILQCPFLTQFRFQFAKATAIHAISNAHTHLFLPWSVNSHIPWSRYLFNAFVSYHHTRLMLSSFKSTK